MGEQDQSRARQTDVLALELAGQMALDEGGLACAVLAGDEHPGVGGGHLADHLAQLVHGRGGPGEAHLSFAQGMAQGQEASRLTAQQYVAPHTNID